MAWKMEKWYKMRCQWYKMRCHTLGQGMLPLLPPVRILNFTLSAMNSLGRFLGWVAGVKQLLCGGK